MIRLPITYNLLFWESLQYFGPTDFIEKTLLFVRTSDNIVDEHFENRLHHSLPKPRHAISLHNAK